MAKKQNVLFTCLIFSLLHSWNIAPKTMQCQTVALKQALQNQAHLAIPIDQSMASKELREVIFEDDLIDLLSLDSACQNRLEDLENIKIIIKAVIEYSCPRGQEVQVKIKDNFWVITMNDMTEDLLLECLPVDDLLPQLKLSRNPLEKYFSVASRWLTKMGIYIWGKTLAKYAKCSLEIHSSIKPEDEHILCSEIMIDLIDMAEGNRLSVERKAKDLLNTQFIISEQIPYAA